MFYASTFSPPFSPSAQATQREGERLLVGLLMYSRPPFRAVLDIHFLPISFACKCCAGQVRDLLRMIGPRNHQQLTGYNKKNALSHHPYFFDSLLFAVALFCPFWKGLWRIHLPWVFKIGTLYSAPLKPRQQATLAVPRENKDSVFRYPF